MLYFKLIKESKLLQNLKKFSNTLLFEHETSTYLEKLC